MADSNAPVSGTQLRAQFARNAVLPEREVNKAETFIANLEQQAAKGAQPSASELQAGRKLLRTLEEQTTAFEFNFAQLAAQEASSDSDIDRRVDAISSGLERTQTMTERLREKLLAYSG